TVKTEMLRSLRHIAETIDAVMIAEGIEHMEDIVALRNLGLRYGQGYYMARPGAAFPTLGDNVRAELRSLTPAAPPPITPAADEDEDDEDRVLAIPLAAGSSGDLLQRAKVPRNEFGRPEDEITSELALPAEQRSPRSPRASEPPAALDAPLSWKPLVDDDAKNEAEPLLDSLKKTGPIEIGDPPDGERGPGQLN